MKKKIGVLRFLGTNCDRDIWQAITEAGVSNKAKGGGEGPHLEPEWPNLEPQWLWYEDQFNPSDYAGFIVPGGFSYGDYLRSGAMAAKAPVMQSLRQAAEKGFPVLGICNGFQILCEAGLLPGALVQNEGRRFIDDWVVLKQENMCPHFAGTINAPIELPIAHGDGRFYAPEDELKSIQDNGQIWFKYERDVNGSVEQIAGVMNVGKNVAALMPHPERALFPWMGSDVGRVFFETLV